MFKLLINTLSNNVDGSTTNTEKLKMELKSNFPPKFSDGLGFCSKLKAKFEFQDTIILTTKASAICGIANIDKELERLEKLGVITKNNYCLWASQIVYVKKRSKIRVCADYSTEIHE